MSHTGKKKGWSIFKFIQKLVALGDDDHAQVVSEKMEKREGDKKTPPLHTRRIPNRKSINDEGFVGKVD